MESQLRNLVCGLFSYCQQSWFLLYLRSSFRRPPHSLHFFIPLRSMRKHRKAVSRNVIADNLSFVFTPGYCACRRTKDVKVIICDLDMLLFSPSCLL
ncbi:hypothetical protein Peur_000769 [Populus x canadensis]